MPFIYSKLSVSQKILRRITDRNAPSFPETQAPRHGGTWRPEGINPRILNLGTTVRWVTGQLHHPAALSPSPPRNHWLRSWRGVRSGLNVSENIVLPFPRIEPRVLSPACSLISISKSSAGSLWNWLFRQAYYGFSSVTLTDRSGI
jgi:hypothetical protein